MAGRSVAEISKILPFGQFRLSSIMEERHFLLSVLIAKGVPLLEGTSSFGTILAKQYAISRTTALTDQRLVPDDRSDCIECCRLVERGLSSWLFIMSHLRARLRRAQWKLRISTTDYSSARQSTVMRRIDPHNNFNSQSSQELQV